MTDFIKVPPGFNDPDALPRLLHSKMYVVEYGCSGTDTNNTDIENAVGNLAIDLAGCVIATVRNQILRTRRGSRASVPVEASDEDGQYDVPVLSCVVQGSASLLESELMGFHSGREARRVRRPQPEKFAKVCVDGVLTSLRGSGLVRGALTEEVITSGKRPIRSQALIKYIAGLSVLTDRPSPSAEAFAREVAGVSNVIFERVTGGALPAVSCDIEYGTLLVSDEVAYA